MNVYRTVELANGDSYAHAVRKSDPVPPSPMSTIERFFRKVGTVGRITVWVEER